MIDRLDEVDEFVKIVKKWKFQKDWEKKGLIFNPETGISEDGTMRDCLFRPWINKPKKEKKMNRAEAISEIDCVLFEQDHLNRKEVMKALKQPVTLAEFLGWEEGREYEYRSGDVLMLENGKIYYKSEKCSSGWCNYAFFGNEIDDLRQAKKIEEPKLKAYHVKDEYSFNSLIEELNEQGYRWYDDRVKYCEGRDVVYCENDYKLMVSSIEYFNSNEVDNYDFIEYHKEEPKYKWRFKGAKTNKIYGKVLYFHHVENNDLILDSYPNVRYITENLLREELRGTRFNVADFERVE